MPSSFCELGQDARAKRSTACEREGRPAWRKERRPAAWFVMRLANVFFRLAGNPVEAIARRADWQHWEVESFRRLHGPEYAAGLDADGTPWVSLLPGQSLSGHLAGRTLTPRMLEAAGAELRRVHGLHCAHHQSGWTHGDPHTGNFLYDSAEGRARLIDFEVRHLRSLAEPDRRADDLLVLLQDICGRCRAEDWKGFASAVLEGYSCPKIAVRIGARIRVPHGFARLWWGVRTTWMRRGELERRLSVLRQILPGQT